MRNITMKSPHMKPSPLNSFKKSDRKYPEAKNSIQTNQSFKRSKMDIQPQTKRTGFQSVLKTQTIFPHGLNHHRFQFFAQNAFPVYDRNSNLSINDPTCIWFKNIQTTPTDTKTYIAFRKGIYIISNWTQDQFPHCISLCVDGVYGYLDENGKPTDRLSTYYLRQMTSSVQTGIQTYELVYENLQTVKWQIPAQLTHVKISLKIDAQTESTQLPLPNPIIIDLQITYQ